MFTFHHATTSLTIFHIHPFSHFSFPVSYFPVRGLTSKRLCTGCVTHQWLFRRCLGCLLYPLYQLGAGGRITELIDCQMLSFFTMADKGIANEKCTQESGYFTTNNARSDAVAIVPSKLLFSVVVLRRFFLFVRVGRIQ